jgi:hypothetical protein
MTNQKWNRTLLIGCCVVAALVCRVPCARAQSSFPYMVMKAEAPDERKEMTAIIPYAISTESLGFTLGLFGITTEGLRAPASLFGTFYYTSNDSAMLAGGARNVYVIGTERFFIDATFMTGRQRERRVYVDGNPLYPVSRSGSNDSDPDDYLSEDTWEGRLDVTFKWVLPIGEGRDEPVEEYIADKGFLVSKPTGGGWIPWESGRTTLSLRPQYWDQFIDPYEEDLTFRTLNALFQIEYDNRDYRPNPARGAYVRGGLTRDWGWLNDTEEWTTIEGEFSQHFWLGENRWMQHQVLAFSAATIDTPSWDETVVDGERTVSGNPPYFVGANLGGMMRLKAFPRDRFHDRAAVHYSGEYRFIPRSFIYPGNRILRALDVQWWQFALIGELGRVAPEWDIKTLHEDMKWDAGLGTRAMFGSAVARMDFMYGEEGFALQAMMGQSF